MPTAAKPRKKTTSASSRAKAKPKPRSRARRSSRSAPQIEQRHLDLTGLGLVALAVFTGFVLYRDRDGGEAGRWLTDQLQALLGDMAYAVPPALAAVGAILVLLPVLPAVRPFRSGGICLFLAATLWLGEADGGAVGGLAESTVGTFVGTFGMDVLAIFLFLAAVLLITGASIASVLKATTDTVSDTTRALRTVAPARQPAAAPKTTGGSRRTPKKIQVPEPEGEEPVVIPTNPGLFEPIDGLGIDDDAPEARFARKRGKKKIEDPVFGEEAEERDATLEQPVDPIPPAPLTEAEEAALEAAAAEHESGGASDFDDHPFTPDAEAPEAEADVDALVPLDPFADADAVDDDEEERDEKDAEVEAATRHIDPGPNGLTPQGRYRQSVLDDPAFQWRMPAPRKVLSRSTAAEARPDTAGQAQTAKNLIDALSHFNVEAQVIGTVSGPHITRYEIKLAPGIKMSKVSQLKDDLAYALAATDIRILAPIPGKTAVGIEVPNSNRKVVQLGDVFTQRPADWSPLTVWLGKDVAGKAVGADLAKMPHLLVAGTTGAGKSACINGMLSSVLLNASPHELKLVLVDPKQVELNHYEGIPHLLTPVITNPRVAANALQNLVKEMEERYSIMALAKTRNLPELNRYRAERGDTALPYVLCVIDELADLMMVAPGDVEDSIIRIAQKARAVGIHLVLATQSPRVDVITGMIKANVPSRIAFAVSSQTDSRVILDQNGAESLLGKGDMLFSPVGSSKLQRIQGAYIDEAQILAITEHWRKQGEPELRDDLLEEVEEEAPADKGGDPDDFDPDEDPLLEEAIHLVAEMGTASTSMLQRRLRLGYTRAGRLIDMLERRGVISGYEGSKPRQVLVPPGDVQRFIEQLREKQGGTD
ncbi:MAG TPA: DNA translocase FtsK [Solirubrobacteraceae bacterium]|nr:DNA translocase FtsK [Solirubrobacteraceae bacterium]